MIITIKKLDEWEACGREPGERYDDAALQRLIGDGISPLQGLDLDINNEDKVWLLTRRGVMTPVQRKEFCDETADRAVRNHALNCGIPKVEKWAQKWLSGDDRSHAAATAAAAAAAIAHAAAHAAASATADAAHAADDAADAAAAAAAAYADAEYQQQVDDLRGILLRRPEKKFFGRT